jgi:hypothetical protein
MLRSETGDHNLGFGKRLALIEAITNVSSDYRERKFPYICDNSVVSTLLETLRPAQSGDPEAANKTTAILHHNLRCVLLGKSPTTRRSLPDGMEAALALLGSPAWGLLLTQIDVSSIAALRALISILQMLLARLETMKISDEEIISPRPRSLFS